jgi:hypothetical protein
LDKETRANYEKRLTAFYQRLATFENRLTAYEEEERKERGITSEFDCVLKLKLTLKFTYKYYRQSG